jgi:hypothetical protein
MVLGFLWDSSPVRWLWGKSCFSLESPPAIDFLGICVSSLSLPEERWIHNCPTLPSQFTLLLSHLLIVQSDTLANMSEVARERNAKAEVERLAASVVPVGNSQLFLRLPSRTTIYLRFPLSPSFLQPKHVALNSRLAQPSSLFFPQSFLVPKDMIEFSNIFLLFSAPSPQMGHYDLFRGNPEVSYQSLRLAFLSCILICRVFISLLLSHSSGALHFSRLCCTSWTIWKISGKKKSKPNAGD